MEKKMVRGVVAIGYGRSGLICFNQEEMEKRGNVVAYTPWHRHDESITVVEKEMRMLADVYTAFTGCYGAAYQLEYRDYLK